jgi:hypothetical protein
MAGKVIDHPPPDRPPKVTDATRNLVIDCALEDGTQSVSGIAQRVRTPANVGRSQRTIRRILHGARFFWGPQRRCPLLTDENCRDRIQFVADWNGRPFADVRALPIIFTDESRFCKGSDGRWV